MTPPLDVIVRIAAVNDKSRKVTVLLGHECVGELHSTSQSIESVEGQRIVLEMVSRAIVEVLTALRTQVKQ